MSGVAVVTDSTSSLAPSLADQAAVVVVPLQVVVDGRSRPESFRPGPGSVTPGAVAAALREGRAVSTSRPSPEAFSAAYAAAVEQGATAIVSVHLSAAISGTCDAAAVAARSAAVPVTVVDSRTVGSGCGFAVLAAADVAAGGGSAEEVAATARRRAAAAITYFCVQNLEYLRRGGRIGTTQALLGSALAVKPLLTVSDGKIAPYERVRTMSRALARLEELASDAVTGALSKGVETTDVAVLHLDNRSAADRLARALGGSGSAPSGSAPSGSAPSGSTVSVMEVSAVLGVHCGPGTVGVVVSPRV